jgi:hypothetical protein
MRAPDPPVHDLVGTPKGRLTRLRCRITHPARNRLVVEALHVLQGEFPSRDVGADLLD